MEEEKEEWLTLEVLSRNFLACCDFHSMKRERAEEGEEGDGVAEAEAAADAAVDTAASRLSEDRLRARRGPRTQLVLDRWRLVF